MINKNSSIDQLLRDLVLEYGKELYTDKQRLYNFIADLYTGEEKLKRSIELGVGHLKIGVSNTLCKYLCQLYTVADILVYICQIVQIFVADF